MEFEDYGQAMKRTVSETSLNNSRSDNKAERSGKGKSKTLWPFIKKNKVTHTVTEFARSYFDLTEKLNLNRTNRARLIWKLIRKNVSCVCEFCF